MQPVRKHKPGNRWNYRPTHAQLLASLKPIITKGAFSLVWVNPDPNPIDLHPEEDDYDPQAGLDD